MATKEKIKKKKGNPFLSKSTVKEDSSLGKQANAERIETKAGDKPMTEENKKDAGREKVRSETPSPPPADVFESPTYGKKRPRSPVAFSQNKVEPIASGSKDSNGSLVSLRSGASVKEAWSNNGEDTKRPSSATSISSRFSAKTEKKSKDKKSANSDSVVSLRSNTAEQNAYIPYGYAKNCIINITDDMRNMKQKHIRIVHDIEAHYRSLENESQTQFMAFVMQYRDKFSGKLGTFQQVLEAHRLDMMKKEGMLREEVESLNEKNTQLLQEKNQALSVSKEEGEKMDAEKVALAAQVSALAGGVGAAEYARLQEEKKALQEEVEELKQRPAQVVTVDREGSSEKSETTKLAAVPVPILMGGRSSEEDEEARKQWTEQILRLQEDVTSLKMDNAKLGSTNEFLQDQVKANSGMAERFCTLEDQYKALSVVALASSGENVNDQISKTEEDKAMMKEEQTRLEGEMEAWEKKFVKKNKREPTEEDKPDSIKELSVQHAEASSMVTSLDTQKETLTSLNSGVVPPPPEMGPGVKAEVETPVVVTVEVKVPDPEVVIALESSQSEVSDLRLQLAELSALGGAAAIAGDTVDKSEVDASNAALLQERAAHDNTKVELENLQKQLDVISDELALERAEGEARLAEASGVLQAQVGALEEEIKSLKSRKEALEEERLKDVPIDTAKEIKNLQNRISVLESEKSSVSVSQAGVTAQVAELASKLKTSDASLATQKANLAQMEERLRRARKEKDDAVRDLTKLLSRKAPAGAGRQKSSVGGAGASGDAALKRENKDLNAKIHQLEKEALMGGAAGAAVAGGDKNVQKRHEKILKELEKRYDMEREKNKKLKETLAAMQDDARGTQKDLSKDKAEVAKLTAELAALGVAAKEGVVAADKVKNLEKDNKTLLVENKTLTENFNSERVLRKKYYNIVEDMKGKIRVYCRARPISKTEAARGNHSVCNSMDEYTLSVQGTRGMKEFNFDHVFMPESSQENVFEDTNNLIQSAVDGYNVCIFAYGQTGSGKTFTMIGDSKKPQEFPGIAPRAFDRIFELVEENKSKFNMQVTVYMMELYNDKLIDLFAKPGTSDDEKMEIKKDKKGLVFVGGAIIKAANTSQELNHIFEDGSKNRHTASTKMNDESSRSHLVISIVIESTSKTTGTVMKGKLSLVDLAGSERVGKTGATAEQLKEAMSINKSLSALGDVISALSSEQSFIPYRNNKLTMLMQDSLGGNAKTLMFVNISPADYNADETIISLTYASRVKLITNDASKNADNKEITRLKAVIMKMKKGEAVEAEDVGEEE